MALNTGITTGTGTRQGPGRAAVALIIAVGLAAAVVVGGIVGQQFGPWSSSDDAATTVTGATGTTDTPALSDLDIFEAFGPFTAPAIVDTPGRSDRYAPPAVVSPETARGSLSDVHIMEAFGPSTAPAVVDPPLSDEDILQAFGP